MKTFIAPLSTAVFVAISHAANLNDETLIRDIEKAHLIVVGSIGPSASGGGGTTSQIKISQILSGSLPDKSTITVFWPTRKSRHDEFGKDFIWFLSPAENIPGAFHDISLSSFLLPADEPSMQSVRESANKLKK